MLTLYTTALSANGRKVLAVSRHLGLEPDVRHVNVYKGEGRMPEHLGRNPLGKIPVLVDGELTLSESNAIVVYLSEAYGDGRLWSSIPRRRADILRWLFWEASEWQPALVPVLASFVSQKLGLSPPRPQVVVDWSEVRFQGLATYLDAHLRRRPFILDELTLADFSVAAMLTYVGDADFPSDAFPSLGAWHARVEALEAWKATAVEPWT